MNKRQQHSAFLRLDDLVSDHHPYRRLDQVVSFSELGAPYGTLYSVKGRKKKGVEFGLHALVLQFMEDLSDREMERHLQENMAGKWFCHPALGEKSPDHSYFGGFRKLTTWDDCDKAIKAGLETFNSETAPKVATDTQARLGCKGNTKFWYGYKEHVSVDMQSGLINKVAAPRRRRRMLGVLPMCAPMGLRCLAIKGFVLIRPKAYSGEKAAMMRRSRKITGRERITAKIAGFLLCAHPTSVYLRIAIRVFVIED